jgi:hypothetical protein
MIGTGWALTTVEVGISTSKSSHGSARSGDKIVVDDIRITLAGTVTCDVAAASAPVVHDLWLH